MDKEKELLSKEELALMRGGFGVEDVTVYALGIQGVNTRCKYLMVVYIHAFMPLIFLF